MECNSRLPGNKHMISAILYAAYYYAYNQRT